MQRNTSRKIILLAAEALSLPGMRDEMRRPMMLLIRAEKP